MAESMTERFGASARFAPNKKDMKKNIIIYGLIAGIIVSILMLFSVNYLSHSKGIDYNTSLLIGYASMLIAFSLVFVGIRNYRDKYNNG
jgi:predicted membrane protein